MDTASRYRRGGSMDAAPGQPKPHPERHPDDLPPPSPELSGMRRRMPRGLIVALALGATTLAIMAYMALGAEPAAEITRLDPNAPTHLDDEDNDHLASGAAMPSLEFETFDGATASLVDFVGTPMVINFWAAWCAPCLVEMPDLESAHLRYGDDVAFVGLNVREAPARARQMAADTGVTYLLGWDRDGELLRAFGGRTMPTTVFVRADGSIDEIVGSALSAAQIDQRIEALIP